MTISVSIDTIWAEFAATHNSILRDELIIEYTPLVRFVVGRLGIPPTSLLEHEDLVSYGMIGLINAIDRFDLARGVRFEAFATPRIRGAVIDQLRVLNWLPRSAVARVRQLETALAALEQRLGRPAQENEAAKAIGVSIERYRQILVEIGFTILSLDAPLNTLNTHDDELTTLSELLEDQTTPDPLEQVERHELSTALKLAAERLPPREHLLLSLYYQQELTMKEISHVMNVSESRVCQLHTQAVMRLRAALTLYADKDGQCNEIKDTRGAQVISGRRKASVHKL